MRLIRTSAVGVIAISGVLALSACGSDSTSGSGSAAGGSTAGASSAADCFSGTLNGEGSTAQKNAIEAAIKTFQTACADATVNYNATGSGAGIKQFIAKQVAFAGSDSALKTEEADQRGHRVRLARVEPADGRRPDRHRLQREGRRQASY